MNSKKVKNPIIASEELLTKKVVKTREDVSKRFPLVIALAATFGLVSVFYGFEKMIDSVDLFVEKPWILFITGLIILIATGTVYKKLD